MTNSLSSVDTNLYPGLVQSFSPNIVPDVPAISKIQAESSYGNSSSSADLSNYYSNIRPEDLVANAGDNFRKTAQDLDKAMIAALQGGMSVNDVINLKMGQLAYNMSARVFNEAYKLETFEIEI